MRHIGISCAVIDKTYRPIAVILLFSPRCQTIGCFMCQIFLNLYLFGKVMYKNISVAPSKPFIVLCFNIFIIFLAQDLVIK